MRGAGIMEFGGAVQSLELPAAGPPPANHVLMRVRAAGVGNWDDAVRNGTWHVGSEPPMALGVEASGVVESVGEGVWRFRPGDEVLCHPLPLIQGTWAVSLVAPESTVARKPGAMSWQVAGAFPVPGLTAVQVVSQAAAIRPDDVVLVHGGGGVTGSLIVAFAAALGARVFATASARSSQRLRGFGAAEVFDYNSPTWRQDLIRHTSGQGVSIAINAVRTAAADLLTLIGDCGRLVSITGDAPEEVERDIRTSNHYVSPNGQALQTAAAEFAARGLSIPIARTCGLADAGAALDAVVSGRAGGAIVIDPRLGNGL